MRGVTRVAPGTLPAARADRDRRAERGVLRRGGRLGPDAPRARPVAGLARGPALEAALSALRDEIGGRAAAAVVTDGKTARTALAT